MGMAESVALGARCLDDLVVNRADAVQAELRGFEVPAPQTAGAWLRRFTIGRVRQLGKAMARAQRNAYVAAGVEQVTLDFDSTYVFSRFRRRQGVDRTYEKGYALHPLLCFDAETGSAVHARLRRRKAARPRAFPPLPPKCCGRCLRQWLCGPVSIRASTPGLCSPSSRQLGSPTCVAPRTLRCSSRPPRRSPTSSGVSCADKEAELSEFGYRMKTGPFRRYIVRRVEILPGRRASLWKGGYRNWIFVTSDHTTSAVELEWQHRQKATVETGMAELKSNFGLHVFRKHGFMANWAWLLIVCLGHNLCAWTHHLGAVEAGRDHGELRAQRLR